MTSERLITGCGREYGCDSMSGHGLNCYVPYVEDIKRKADALDVLLAAIRKTPIYWHEETEDTRWYMVVDIEQAIARVEADAE